MKQKARLKVKFLSERDLRQRLTYQEVGEILHPVHDVLHGFQRRQVDADLQGEKFTSVTSPVTDSLQVIPVLTRHSHQSPACLVL